jgi:hypothetical protein
VGQAATRICGTTGEMAVRILVLSTGIGKSVLSQCIVRALSAGGHAVFHPVSMDVNSSLRDYDRVVVMCEDMNCASQTKMLALRAMGEVTHSLVYDPLFEPQWAFASHANLVYQADLQNAHKLHSIAIGRAIEHLHEAPRWLEPAFAWKRETWDPTIWAPIDVWDTMSIRRGSQGLVINPDTVAEVGTSSIVKEENNLAPWSWRLAAAAHFGVPYFGDVEYFKALGPCSSYALRYSDERAIGALIMQQKEELRSWQTMDDADSAELLSKTLLTDLRQGPVH